MSLLDLWLYGLSFIGLGLLLISGVSLVLVIFDKLDI